MRMQMMKNLHLTKLAVVLLIITALSACSLPKRPALETSSWMLAPERTGAPYKPRSDLWLKMGSSSATPPFDGKSLVYRLGDQRYEKDFYNTYSALPNEMVGNATRQWLNNAQIFSMTVGQGNSFFPYYILQTSIEEFYGDYRVRPEAVVTIEFFLTATDPQKRNPVIGKNRYSKRVTLKDNTPQALVQGQQEALAQILKEYEVVLYKYAGNLPPPLGQ
ncbi:membrane integrity-associated transporter subunit PqiC [Polynucleobacter sp. AP-Elch-400A-B2]|jgi:cholesterol transport system auxiliary component|uniref:ABC-type transport auxiliary lipoprotein family protein n=1 Tax=Polynucleobacter sp. AP-Elch-400A-B2 TaxID=2576930 RepID=UPI0020414CA0|nr:ABC-type transport auxiliary lipoprotein family protein [Polynucleobacter sp. AP-Elch-400A-B2]QWE25427.1 membrane integrity-associated transporter subunit PqiC [Polynucleobacter sp. AP-Elch-400A-B2]